MALRDPELLAAAASAIGAKALMPLLDGPTPSPRNDYLTVSLIPTTSLTGNYNVTHRLRSGYQKKTMRQNCCNKKLSSHTCIKRRKQRSGSSWRSDGRWRRRHKLQPPRLPAPQPTLNREWRLLDRRKQGRRLSGRRHRGHHRLRRRPPNLQRHMP